MDVMKIKCALLLLLSGFLLGCNGNKLPLSSNTISSVENLKYTVIEQYIYKDNSKIYGKLYTPVVVKDKYPLVILAHSAFLTGDSLKEYAKEFANRGFMAFTFDFCGGSPFSKSDGNIKDMTIFTEVDDLKTIIMYFRNNTYVDIDNIYLFGTSQGGLVSAITANDYKEYIKGLMLLYPAFNIPDQVKDTAYSSYMPMGEAYFDTLKNYDVYEHIASFTHNVIIIHGDSDTMVSLEYSKKANDVYQNSQLYIITGAGHGFNKDNYSSSGDYDLEVWKYLDKFLLECNNI